MKGLKHAIVIGIFYLLLVSTYVSFSFIVTYMYEHKKQGLSVMGPVILFSNYFVFLITNSFAPYFRISLKNLMIIASLCYTINYALQIPILPDQLGIVISIFGAFIGGFGAALLWIAYGAYIKTLCKINNQQQIQGKYFGVSNGITFSSVVLGPIVTTFCLKYFSDQIYFVLLTLLGCVSLLFCWFFLQQLQPFVETNEEHDWCKQLQTSLSYYKKMTALIPTFIYDGFVLGFVSTSITNIMPQETSRIETGICLIILGVGCVIGGFSSGYISDLIHMKNSGRISIIICLLVSIITIFIPAKTSKGLAYFCAFLWGIARQYIQGWIYVACSRNYQGRLESFGNFKQLHSFSFCIYQVFAILTKLKIQVSHVMIIFIVLSPLCLYYLNFLPQASKKNDKQRNFDEIVSPGSSSQQND